MEGETSKKSKKNDKSDDGNENQKGSSEKPSTSSNLESEKKSTSKRNYRRRTEAESSSGDDLVVEANNVVDQQAGEEVLVDNNIPEAPVEHFIIDDDPEGGNDFPVASDSSQSDSDSDFSSPLSPLLRFGLGGRRLFGASDSDSDSTEYDEEVREKAKRTTTEILSKNHPTHLYADFSWPEKIFNRQQGFFSKPHEARYQNHRKVFERNFHGSLNAVERLELMSKLEEHLGCVNCLGFSKNGLYLLSGSDDLRIILWSWYNQKAISIASSKHKKNIFQTKFYDESNEQLKAVSASADGSISIHQFTNDGGHTEKLVYTHTGAVHKLAIVDNATILSCGEDGAIIEFDFRTKQHTKLLTVREKHRKIPLFSITAHPNECKYAVSGRDKFVRVYDRRNERHVLTRHCPQEVLDRNASLRYISCCVYNYNGSELLASFNDESIYLFNAHDQRLGSYLHSYKGHINSATIKGVNFFGAKSEYIVTGSDCSHIFFYEKESESIVQFMPADENGIINVLEPHPIYPILATSGLDKDIKIWMPSNDSFELNRDSLKKCVGDNMRNQLESAQSNSTFSVDPAILELARRFFHRHRETSPQPVYNDSSSDDSD